MRTVRRMAVARQMSWGANHIIPPRGAGGLYLPTDAILRFVKFCRFEPETGCVIWTGAQSWGRGKSIRYGSFRDQGKTWLAHRWSAKFIRGLEIEGLQVDHNCPNIPIPNHLCVEHGAPMTGERNRHLQTERRRHFVHLEVGLLPYEDVYGPPAELNPDAIPFYEPPEWLVKAKAML